jgi:hypothetical protein
VPPLLANLRTSAATGNLRRNPLYLIAFLLFFICAADKLSDYLRNNDIHGLAYVALVLVVGTSTIAMLYHWRIVIELRGAILFPIALVILRYAFLVLAPFTFNGLNAYQNFVMNAYLWLLIGVLYRLPTMKLMAQPAKVPVQSQARRFGAL